MCRCRHVCSICSRNCSANCGLTYLFIGHDLAVIQQMSHDVLVMRDGEAVEYRPAAELFAAPEQEYTRALLAAVPPARPRAAVSGNA